MLKVKELVQSLYGLQLDVVSPSPPTQISALTTYTPKKILPFYSGIILGFLSGDVEQQCSGQWNM